MSNKRVIVIMAGGTGERFWPLSRQKRPKQLLNLTSPDKSLLAEAVERVCPAITTPENVFVATARNLQEPIRQANLGIPPENILGEPCKRNTAGCLAFAAACLQARYKCDPATITMGVITADQQIGDPDEFRLAITAAFEAAESHDALVTLGIHPTRPETGYGYIEVGEDMTNTYSNTTGPCPAYPVLRFREKPDRETAGRFLATGHFLWNSGMFFWRVSTFQKELQLAKPEHAQAVENMVEAMNACDAQRVDRTFAALDDISIDYALLEKARKVLVVPAAFSWDDVGALDALERTLPSDTDGNIAVGNPILNNTRNCIVYNEAGDKMAVAVLGAYDLVVVVTDDAVLVVPKHQAQEVKTALAELKKRNAKQI